jgi:ABC-type nitrate/sulfonate/bicarbonate transport system permease component
MMGVFVLGLIAAVMYFFAAWLEKKVIKYWKIVFIKV